MKPPATGGQGGQRTLRFSHKNSHFSTLFYRKRACSEQVSAVTMDNAKMFLQLMFKAEAWPK